MSKTGKFRDQRKQMSVCLRLREEEWGVTAPGDRVSFGADEHNVGIATGDGGKILERS